MGSMPGADVETSACLGCLQSDLKCNHQLCAGGAGDMAENITTRRRFAHPRAVIAGLPTCGVGCGCCGGASPW